MNLVELKKKMKEQAVKDELTDEMLVVSHVALILHTKASMIAFTAATDGHTELFWGNVAEFVCSALFFAERMGINLDCKFYSNTGKISDIFFVAELHEYVSKFYRDNKLSDHLDIAYYGSDLSLAVGLGFHYADLKEVDLMQIIADKIDKID